MFLFSVLNVHFVLVLGWGTVRVTPSKLSAD